MQSFQILISRTIPSGSFCPINRAESCIYLGASSLHFFHNESKILLLLLSTIGSFSHKFVVFHWIFRDGKSPQVSRTYLDILADLKNSVVWMVSILPLISNSTCPFLLAFWEPTTIFITVKPMFHNFFFTSLGTSKYLSPFSFTFIFTL